MSFAVPESPSHFCYSSFTIFSVEAADRQQPLLPISAVESQAPAASPASSTSAAVGGHGTTVASGAGDAWLEQRGRQRRTYKTGSVHEHYEIGETLGKGTFAVVKEARHRTTGERVVDALSAFPARRATLSEGDTIVVADDIVRH
jgi:hypothetical protein